MADLTLRNVKNAPLTNQEVDDNFTNLNNDKAETDGATLTNVDINSGSIDSTTIGGSTPAAGSFTTGQFDTSLNVDGTITVNGVRVDGSIEQPLATFGGTREYNVPIPTATNAKTTLEFDGTSDFRQKLTIKTNKVQSDSAPTNTFEIAQNGDIIFYDNSGVNQSFFWDASAESLGLGTTSPATALDVDGTVTADALTVDGIGTVLISLNNTLQDARLELKKNGTQYGQVSVGTDQMNLVASGASTVMRFLNNAGEAMRLDSSGNLLLNNTNSIIATNTVDGADNKSLLLAGGGTSSVLRGGYISIRGNEYASNAGGISYATGKGSAAHVWFDGESASERMRLDSSGNLDMTAGGGDIIMANGAGIDFSASEGGGASSSVLDDYEEGTWTPLGNNITFSTAQGTYTKIGRQVIANFKIIFPSTADASVAYVSTAAGLPFAPNGTYANYRGGAFISYTNLGSDAVIYFGSQPQFVTLSGTNITNATLSGKEIHGVITYITA